MRKRLFDIVVSATLLALLWPLLALIAIAVRLTSEGPAIFRQERLGLHKEPFIIWKFRTMHQGASLDTRIRPNDPRITSLGRFLRSVYLDELPQLWNILKGEMSLVGPRPKPQHAFQSFETCVPGYEQRFSVRPGLTGPSQIRGRALVPTARQDRIQQDIAYAARQSFWHDAWLLICTIPMVLKRRGI